MTNKQIRLNRIFKQDGKTVIAAMDHGIGGITPLAHLEFPRVLLPELVQNGADAIITTPGIARQCSDLFAGAGLILRIDGGPSALTGDWGGDGNYQISGRCTKVGGGCRYYDGNYRHPGRSS